LACVIVLHGLCFRLCGRQQEQGHNEENAYTTQNSNGHLVLSLDCILLFGFKVWNISANFS
jgi:hypothetical protein